MPPDRFFRISVLTRTVLTRISNQFVHGNGAVLAFVGKLSHLQMNTSVNPRSYNKYFSFKFLSMLLVVAHTHTKSSAREFKVSLNRFNATKTTRFKEKLFKTKLFVVLCAVERFNISFLLCCVC